MTQAQKFGARISSPCQVARLEAAGDQLEVTLTDGTPIATRAVVVATGARYRSLPLSRWSDFEGAGIYYAATDLEARICTPHPVVVVAGANSAGQAALYLASRGSDITLVVRARELHAGMSAYLADRIVGHPAIAVRTGSEVTELQGAGTLQSVIITGNSTGATVEQSCRGLFCFIGALAATEWLTGVDLDDHGFVRTGGEIPDGALDATWDQLGRRPLPFETSQPNVFAAGDVRSGSMKRVAAAVGEGASAIRSVHTALGRIGVRGRR